MKKLLFTLMAVVLCLGLVGGAFAYFSDTETSINNTFTTGTLDLVLSNDYVNWANGVSGTWNSPAGWAPGENYTATIYLGNTGSVDAMAVYTDWDWSSVAGYTDLANWIQVTGIWDSTDGYSFNAIPPPPGVDITPFDGKISLYELASWSERNSTTWPGDIWTAGYPAAGTDPAIAANGGTLGIRFQFKLMEAAGNDLQGKSLAINVVFTATQNILP
jgi:predicted ribosomally synthesized peptide with SipW-like signal peptide